MRAGLLSAASVSREGALEGVDDLAEAFEIDVAILRILKFADRFS